MRLTKFNPETGQYVITETPKTYSQLMAQRKAVIQKLGEYEDKSTEVAEEIFGEIERMIDRMHNLALFGISIDTARELAELKKKYTEGK